MPREAQVRNSASRGNAVFDMAADYTFQAFNCQNRKLSKTNTTDMPSRDSTLILASTSTYRANLLDRLGIPFETSAPAADESRLPNEPFDAMAARLSQAKAKSIRHPNALIIGSDQVAVVGEQQLHKPGSINRAEEQLELISGRTVQFYTGVSLWNTATDRCQTEVVQYKATLRDLNHHEIEAYVAADSPLDCAGAFKWERLGISLMEALEGADPTALEGLPLIALCNMLRKEGLALP
jgi:septum formation protein|tara:strand:- start:4062 stop:4775 length:714 start_codon:yes stop_codon:yes gene_type:complete